ncbi:hypothetical protein ACTXKY_06220 [Corynebacterium variabile]|uniref:hypothetical protein n=1 Tax=Corynebacterium variabile TaxID=1727 RepID=UPI0026480A24|nr:hypothetical protein [Corynebacterium variabile]MDN6676399.1 hypothetical protein [Corynebacterium variabile]MDN6844135.1 hypothetical protein [Corynebacterium variabile]
MTSRSVVKPTGKNRPVTVDEVLPLWEDGKSKAEIARALHTSGYYVEKAAKEAGLTWDRAQTEVATQARIIDAVAQRAVLADAMREMSAEGIRMALDRKAKPADRKAGAIIAGIGAQRDMELSRHLREERAAQRQDAVDRAVEELCGDPLGILDRDDEPP